MSSGGISPTKLFIVVSLAIVATIGIGCIIGFTVSQNNTDSNQSSASKDDVTSQDEYYVGVSRVDITGPIVQVNMMGYAHPEQVANGLHTRLYSRAYVISDIHQESRVAFVTFDGGMASQLLKIKVLEKLKETTDNFTEKNVVISGTHSHSGPAGFFQYLLFEVTSLGHVVDTTESFVNGIAESIINANSDLKRSRIYYGREKLAEPANINRSPTSYMKNPQSERNKYASNTEEEIDVLKFQTVEDGEDIAMLSWYPSHPTSMNFTNLLISADHKGRASTLFEQSMRKDGEHILEKEKFVAAFAQANVGDVSPRTKGAICIEMENATTVGEACDAETSTCDGRSQGCVAFGPGVDMFDSTDIIARRQFDAVNNIFHSTTKMKPLKGTVSYVQQYINMADTEFKLDDGTTVKSCRPGMGYSFAAGTTDGAGAFTFYQGMTEGEEFWDNVRDALVNIICTTPPPDSYYQCQSPKPVLLPTGYMDKPRAWHPDTVEVQMLKVGQLIIAAVPGEFTTMSGRRLKEAIKSKLDDQLDDVQVVIAGLSNVYTHYITTPEEYSAQRYEAASTIYGPNTLNIYLQKFKDLVAPLITGGSYDGGKAPVIDEPDQSRLSKIPGNDQVPRGVDFGDVLIDVQSSYNPGDIVKVTFQAANPRQNLKLGSTYLQIIRINADDSSEEILFNDADWETKLTWREQSPDEYDAGAVDVNIFTAMSDVIADSVGTRLDVELALQLRELAGSEEAEYLNKAHGKDENFMERLREMGIVRDEEPSQTYQTWRGSSEVDIIWNIPTNQPDGNYQIIYNGDAKQAGSTSPKPFQGRSSVFKVQNS